MSTPSVSKPRLSIATIKFTELDLGSSFSLCLQLGTWSLHILDTRDCQKRKRISFSWSPTPGYKQNVCSAPYWYKGRGRGQKNYSTDNTSCQSAAAAEHRTTLRCTIVQPPKTMSTPSVSKPRLSIATIKIPLSLELPTKSSVVSYGFYSKTKEVYYKIFADKKDLNHGTSAVSLLRASGRYYTNISSQYNTYDIRNIHETPFCNIRPVDLSRLSWLNHTIRSNLHHLSIGHQFITSWCLRHRAPPITFWYCKHYNYRLSYINECRCRGFMLWSISSNGSELNGIKKYW